MGPEMTIIAPRPLRKPGDKSQVIRHSDTGTVTETVCRDSAMLPTGRLAGAVWPAVQAAFRPGPSANHARRNAQHADLASSWNLTGNRQAWSSGHGPLRLLSRFDGIPDRAVGEVPMSLLAHRALRVRLPGFARQMTDWAPVTVFLRLAVIPCLPEPQT